ncbi:unnamed protein product [Nezara viridula]|uniref:Uncharacterized protein n=1 Tax=Nezara viridula TaxID=85310 RepID=A0A9P0MQB2_NEZVI|nr:unnamed protein product [Nezara viridula]
MSRGTRWKKVPTVVRHRGTDNGRNTSTWKTAGETKECLRSVDKKDTFLLHCRRIVLVFRRRGKRRCLRRRKTWNIGRGRRTDSHDRH